VGRRPHLLGTGSGHCTERRGGPGRLWRECLPPPGSRASIVRLGVRSPSDRENTRRWRGQGTLPTSDRPTAMAVLFPDSPVRRPEGITTAWIPRAQPDQSSDMVQKVARGWHRAKPGGRSVDRSMVDTRLRLRIGTRSEAISGKRGHPRRQPRGRRSDGALCISSPVIGVQQRRGRRVPGVTGSSGVPRQRLPVGNQDRRPCAGKVQCGLRSALSIGGRRQGIGGKRTRTKAA